MAKRDYLLASSALCHKAADRLLYYAEDDYFLNKKAQEEAIRDLEALRARLKECVEIMKYHMRKDFRKVKQKDMT